MPREVVARSALGVLAVVVTVAALLPYRARIDQVDVVLPLLVAVLIGSMAGGRALGLALALLGFIAIDYFFQPPFDQLSVNKGHDWLVLVSFLLVAGIATQLLARTRAAAESARRRAAEIGRLAELGAETLAAGRAEDSLQATAEIIERTMRLRRCDIYVRTDDDVRWVAGAPHMPAASEPMEPEALDKARRVFQQALPARSTAGDEDSRSALPTMETSGSPSHSERFILLQSHRRAVGVLRMVSERHSTLDDGQRTFLDAISLYAALAAERVHLVAESEHVAVLREADRLKDMVLATVSHDLRTPLTTIKMLADSGIARGDPDAIAIAEQADRLSRMVGDLLDLSRARAGALPLSVELNAAADLVGAAERRTRALFAGRRLERRLDESDDALLFGWFDFVASLRVLTNLLENAAKYAPVAETVTLHVHRQGTALLFEVADRGPGVLETERARIFTPFYRSPDAPADVGGSGLGLAVAATLASAQGGALEYAPRSGGGSVFTLRLVAAEPDDVVRGGA